MTRPPAARRNLLAGGALLALLAAVAVSAPWIATARPWIARDEGRLVVFPERVEADAAVLRAPVAHDPLAVDVGRALRPPSVQHPCGTDALGRDVLSRLIHGARNSFGAGLLATLLALAAAVSLGGAAALSPRVLDEGISRAADIFNAFPALVGAVALLGSGAGLTWLPDGTRVAVVVALFAWPGLFRYVRAELARLGDSDLAAAARASGASAPRVALRHLLPLSLAPVAVPASFVAAGTILAEAGLGFLGLGIGPPEPSWGNLLRDGMAELRSAWWLAAFPGAAVLLTTLGFQLVGEGLRGPVRGGARATGPSR